MRATQRVKRGLTCMGVGIFAPNPEGIKATGRRPTAGGLGGLNQHIHGDAVRLRRQGNDKWVIALVRNLGLLHL